VFKPETEKAGICYEIISMPELGLDVCFLYGEVTIFYEKRNAGGIYTGATVGFQF